MKWVASTLHTTLEHGVSSITTADAHTSAASSRLNSRPHQFKCTCPFRRKMKPGFCACAITFQLASTNESYVRISSTHPAVLPMNMVSKDTDTDVALPYYSAATDMMGYYTVLGMDMWYSIWFWGQTHTCGYYTFHFENMLHITCDNGLMYHIHLVPY